MAREYRIGALWIGGALSYLEQLCLKSYVDAGQQVVLYSYDDVGNVPEGVERADGREILEMTDALCHGRTGSPAIQSDLFRLHMLAKNPDMIWADTDAYCVRPYRTSTGHFYAWESRHGVASGVLGLPPDSDTLAALLDYSADPHPIPPWFAAAEQDRLRQLRDAGTPVHVSDLPWGVSGPAAVSHFLKVTGEIRYALPSVALYPFLYRDRREMLRPGVRLQDYVTAETFSIHFYGRRMRARLLSHGVNGAPRRRSVLGQLLIRHGIDPAEAPLRRPPEPPEAGPASDGATQPVIAAAAARKPVAPAQRLPAPAVQPAARGPVPQQAAAAAAAELAAVGDLSQLRRITDLSGGDRGLLLRLMQGSGAELQLPAMDGGQPFSRARAARALKAWLVTEGVPDEQIRVIRRAEALQPADLVLNLNGFGAQWKRPISEALRPRLWHADSVMLSDIRRGSGAWGWLKGMGPTAELAPAVPGAPGVIRVSTRPGAPAEGIGAEGAAAGWAELARDLAGPDGFFRDLGTHSFTYIPRSPEVLVVSFDNLDLAMDKRADRRPWGFDFIEKQGWSMLAVMAGGWTWYRDAQVPATFEDLRDQGFFERFQRVVFYGASMGGYAAAAFSAVVPGAAVVAISPQSTLDRALVPWESRYKSAWGRDFSGPYGDAAVASRSAGQVVLLYDPREPLDRGHAERFTGANVLKLRAPLMGHRLGSSLAQMGLLSGLLLAALEGRLTAPAFHRALRARRDFPRYQRELFERALARGHERLARAMAESVLRRMDNRALRAGLAKLQQSELRHAAARLLPEAGA